MDIRGSSRVLNDFFALELRTGASRHGFRFGRRFPIRVAAVCIHAIDSTLATESGGRNSAVLFIEELHVTG